MGKYCVVISVADDYQHAQPESVADVDDYINEFNGNKTTLTEFTTIQNSYQEWCNNSGCSIPFAHISTLCASLKLNNIVSIANIDGTQLFIIE